MTVLPFDPDPRLLGAFLALAVTAAAVVMGLALRRLVGRYLPENDPRRQLIAQAMLYGGTFIFPLFTQSILRFSPTETGLAITGDSTGNLLALRASDGTSLWHENIGRMSSAPVTYELDGKQYLLVSGGNTLYAYALP